MAMIPSNPPPDRAEEMADGEEVPEFDWSVLRQEAAKTATDNSVIDRTVLSVSLVLRRNISALLFLTNVERSGYAASFISLLRSGLGQQLHSIVRLPLAIGVPVALVSDHDHLRVASSPARYFRAIDQARRIRPHASSVAWPRYGDDYFAASSVLANDVRPCLTIASCAAGTCESERIT